MKTIRVTVILPATFQFEVPENWDTLSIEEKQDLIKDHAVYLWEIDPDEERELVIHDCEDESLIE